MYYFNIAALMSRYRAFCLEMTIIYQLIDEFPHFYVHNQPCRSDRMDRLFAASAFSVFHVAS